MTTSVIVVAPRDCRPAPAAALFPVRVAILSTTVVWLAASMPPPAPLALLPETVTWFKVRVAPAPALMPPPLAALLPETTTLVIVTKLELPALMPPPELFAAPPVIFRLLKLTVTPELLGRSKTRSPLTVLRTTVSSALVVAPTKLMLL